MINWKVRLRNPDFWTALIPALLVLAQCVAALFGYTLELDEIGKRALSVIDSLFVLLTIVGIVNDPTTAGRSDSEQAMTYTVPKPKPDTDND